MPLYTPGEAKAKRGQGLNIRKLELAVGVPRKIWLPSDQLLYKRVHYNIRRCTSFKHAKYDALDCFNQKAEEDGKGCPICEERQQMWAEWRKAKKDGDKALMAKLLKPINEIFCEYQWGNCIDLDDENQEFQGVCFTKGVFPDLERVQSKYGINNVIFIFKKGKNGEKISYSLTEITDLATTVQKMQGKLDELMARSYDDGGPIDLEKTLERQYTKDEYMDLLTNGEESDERDHDPKETAPSSSKKEAPKNKSTIEIDESDSITLDDLEAGNTTKDKPKEPDKPKEESLDSLDLDGLDLEPLTEPEKFVKVSAKEINEKRNDKAWVEKIYNFLLQEKVIQAKEQYRDKLMEVFNFAKKGDIEMPEKYLK